MKNEILRKISVAMCRAASLEGPIPTTACSKPFCTMESAVVQIKPESVGYAEIEYFLAGAANIYDANECDEPFIAREAMPYRTRLLVRHPADMSEFSGRVYVDILNATMGYDIEDLWHRVYKWLTRNGHGYVGITSKPVCAMSLKEFDYERYKSLNWSNGEDVPRPVAARYGSVPGTEEGLAWDMLGQLASLIRSGKDDNCFDGVPVRRVYLTGQSQSAAYLNTFVHYFGAAASLDGPLFDGYMNIAGAQIKRRIRQDRNIKPLHFLTGDLRPIDTPFITIAAEGDARLFKEYFGADITTVKTYNSDVPGDKRRHYDIAGAPHTDTRCPMLSSRGELEKMGRPFDGDVWTFEGFNDFPAGAYIAGLLDMLNEWVCDGKAPPVIEPFTAGGGTFIRDEHGNIRGGLRSPFLDVPIATYVASSPDYSGGVVGKTLFFTREKARALYGNTHEYIKKFSAYAERQAEEGWISRFDAEEMKEWAAAAGVRVFGERSGL
jgi:hypothetical protein